MCWQRTPDTGCSPVMVPQDLAQVMEEKSVDHRVDVSFSSYVTCRYTPSFAVGGKVPFILKKKCATSALPYNLGGGRMLLFFRSVPKVGEEFS